MPMTLWFQEVVSLHGLVVFSSGGFLFASFLLKALLEHVKGDVHLEAAQGTIRMAIFFAGQGRAELRMDSQGLLALLLVFLHEGHLPNIEIRISRVFGGHPWWVFG